MAATQQKRFVFVLLCCLLVATVWSFIEEFDEEDWEEFNDENFDDEDVADILVSLKAKFDNALNHNQKSFKQFRTMRGLPGLDRFINEGDNEDAAAYFKNYLTGPHQDVFDDYDNDAAITNLGTPGGADFKNAIFWHATDPAHRVDIQANGFRPTVPDDFMYDGAICGKMRGVFFSVFETKPQMVNYPRDAKINSAVFKFTDPNAQLRLPGDVKLESLRWYFVTLSTGRVMNLQAKTTQVLILMTSKDAPALGTISPVKELNKATNPFIRLVGNKIKRVKGDYMSATYGKINLNIFVDLDDPAARLTISGRNFQVESVPTAAKKREDDIAKALQRTVEKERQQREEKRGDRGGDKGSQQVVNQNGKRNLK